MPDRYAARRNLTDLTSESAETARSESNELLPVQGMLPRRYPHLEGRTSLAISKDGLLLYVEIKLHP